MIAHRCRAVLALVVVLGLPRLAAGGPLQNCCSSKNVFCVLPWPGGGAACTAAGGQFFRANACTRTLECGVAHQLPARGRVGVRVQTPQGELQDMVPLQGAADVIETEMLMLELRGIGRMLGPIRLHDDPMQPSVGMLMPPDMFPADSFFDVFYEIEIPNVGMLHNMQPQRISAMMIAGFPPFGMPYMSVMPVRLFDMRGEPIGEASELVVEFLEPPDTDRDGVVDSGDLCPDTMAAAVVNDNGCSVDQLCPCPARNHGDHVSCVAHQVREFVRLHLLSQSQGKGFVRAAAHTPCTIFKVSRSPTPSPTPITPTRTPTRTRTATRTQSPQIGG